MEVQMLVQGPGIFVGNLYYKKNHIGGIGLDKDGLYANLHRPLTINEMMELLTMVKSWNGEFQYKKMTISYVNQDM